MRARWLVGAVVSILVTAPGAAGQDLWLGVHGGGAAADVSTDNPELGDTYRRAVPAFGVFMVIRANDRIEVAPNLLYQPQGFRVERTGTDATFAVDHVTLPLLLRVRLLSDGAFRPRVFAGPSIAFEADCRIEGTVDGVEGDFDCEGSSIDIQTATTLYTIVFGGGVDVERGRWMLGVEGRFDYGLTDLDVDPDTPNIKLRTYSILASVAFAVR